MTSRTERLRRLAAVGMLTRSYVHEFNNVLGGILGTAQLLALSQVDPDHRARLATIVASVKRGIALTTSLAAVARGDRSSEPTDAHVLLCGLLEDQALPTATTFDLQATNPLMRVDGGALCEAVIVFALLVAARPESPLVISTHNRATASSRVVDGPSDALPWVQIAIIGDRSLTAGERRLIEQPLSAVEDASSILVAAASAAIKQERGRVVIVDDAAAPSIHLFLPVA